VAEKYFWSRSRVRPMSFYRRVVVLWVGSKFPKPYLLFTPHCGRRHLINLIERCYTRDGSSTTPGAQAILGSSETRGGCGLPGDRPASAPLARQPSAPAQPASLGPGGRQPARAAWGVGQRGGVRVNCP
jgi:hypothetical protein